MTSPRQPEEAPATAGRSVAVFALVFVVVSIVAVAFRGSWGALRDAALTCHVDPTSSALYPFAVDGLLIAAIIAAVLLRHDRGARRYCLGIIGGYTFASWLINFLHGLGQFSVNPATGHRPVPPWPVVVVVATLMIGSIFLGSHLVVYVWRHIWPEPRPNPQPAMAANLGHAPAEPGTAAPEPPIDRYTAAKNAYRHSLTPGLKTLTRETLMADWKTSRREADRIRQEVADELTTQTSDPEPDDVPATETCTPYGHHNGQLAKAATEQP